MPDLTSYDHPPDSVDAPTNWNHLEALKWPQTVPYTTIPHSQLEAVYDNRMMSHESSMRLVSSHMPHPCLQIKKRCGALLSLSVAGQRSAAVVNVHVTNETAPIFYAAVCPPFERLE